MSEDFGLKFRVELEGKDEVSEALDNATGKAKRLGLSLKDAGAALSSFAGKAKSELGDFAGKELNGSLGARARGVLELRDALSKLAVSAGGGTEMIAGLDEQVQKVARSSNQMQTAVVSALQAFVERDGDIVTARKNIELYGKVATATSASLEDVARAGQALSSKFNIKDQAQSFAILAAQAKVGSIELRDIATQGNSIFTAARSANIGGAGHEEEGVRQIGGLLQDIAGGARGKGKATAADAVVQIRGIFSQIRQNAGKIEALGVEVGDRNYIDVVRDLIVKTGGDPRALAAIFRNERAFAGISTLATQYRDEHGFKTLDKYTNTAADPARLDQDFSTRRNSPLEKLKQTQIAIDSYFDKYLGAVSEWAAAHASELQAGTIALGLAGKGISIAGRVGALLPGGLGDKVGSVTAQRVYVVNWPGGGVPGVPGDGNEGTKGGVLGAAGKWALGLLGGAPGAALLPAAGLVAVGYEIHKQQEGVKATEKRFNDANPILDPESAKYFGTEYARAHKAVIRHGGMETGDLGTLPAPQVNITIHSNEELKVTGDSGTRDPKVIDKRRAGGG